ENKRIRKIVISTGVVTTLAGSGSVGSVDGTGTSASFNKLGGITIDGTNLYVSDRNNNKIRKIGISTGVVTTFAGPAAGSTTSGSTNGTGTTARFNQPFGITSDGINLYVADHSNHKIRKIVISTGVVTTLAGTGSSGSTDGTGTLAKFYGPAGITIDGTNLYVADLNNHKIRKITIGETEATDFAMYNLDDDLNVTVNVASNNTAEGTVSPSTLTFTPNNWQTNQTVTVTGVDDNDADGHKGYAISLSSSEREKDDPMVTTFAGSGSSGSEDATGTNSTFNYPNGITSDGTNLYVADKYSHKIRKIVIATGVVTTLAGGGSGGNDGTGTTASFNSPTGITSDGTNLYVADFKNHKIRKIVIATGAVTTVAGTGSSGSANGTGT
ncbi:uncharacterized protein METZ01_LOCUS301258, partial [marine metagenome]